MLNIASLQAHRYQKCYTLAGTQSLLLYFGLYSITLSSDLIFIYC